MRRARLADVVHMFKVSVLRGDKRAIMITIITITNVFNIKQKSDALVSIFLTKILIFSKTEVKYVR